jgi:hypothetical protein
MRYIVIGGTSGIGLARWARRKTGRSSRRNHVRHGKHVRDGIDHRLRWRMEAKKRLAALSRAQGRRPVNAQSNEETATSLATHARQDPDRK